MTMSTKFTNLQDDFEAGDWPESRHHIRTLVEGSLADAIRARVGREGRVVIVETGAEGGYSEYAVEWDWSIAVEVGGEEVWRDDWAIRHIDWSDEYPPSQHSPLVEFQAWVDGS